MELEPLLARKFKRALNLSARDFERDINHSCLGWDKRNFQRPSDLEILTFTDALI
jgi:hypothetical protein